MPTTAFDLDATIKARHSTRRFLPTQVPKHLLDEALEAEAQKSAPNIPPLPKAFQRFRHNLGVQVYGAMDIAREDKESRTLPPIICMFPESQWIIM